MERLGLTGNGSHTSFTAHELSVLGGEGILASSIMSRALGVEQTIWTHSGIGSVKGDGGSKRSLRWRRNCGERYSND